MDSRVPGVKDSSQMLKNYKESTQAKACGYKIPFVTDGYKNVMLRLDRGIQLLLDCPVKPMTTFKVFNC